MPENATLSDETRDSLIPTAHANDGNLEQEVERLADALAARFEEISLIHELSESLNLESGTQGIIDSLLVELGPCLSASTIAIHLHQADEFDSAETLQITGDSISTEQFAVLAEQAEVQSAHRCGEQSGTWVNNHVRIGDETFRVVVVTICCQTAYLGQMLAVRKNSSPEFGTVEADLMKSTSLMLAVQLMNQRQYNEMQHMFEATIQSLALALDAKDSYTCGHSKRVSELTVELARRLGYDDDSLARVRLAGILHDIGKIGIDDAVLGKPGRLTDEEFDQIKLHPVVGYDILKGIRQFRNLLPAVRHHHESWDGSGYPDGLAGDEIPRDAQIMAVADAFDAMTSDRPYRSGMPLEKVVAIFEGGRGSQWTADVVDTLLGMPDVMKQYASH